jgi:hypothetical protein
VEQFFRYTEDKTGRKLLSRRKETEECRDDREKGILYIYNIYIYIYIEREREREGEREHIKT